MDFKTTPDDLQLQGQIRDFLSTALPDDMKRRASYGYHPSKEDLREWMRILNTRGWNGYNWPREHGGTGWNPVQADLIVQELAAAGAPQISNLGVFMVAPVIFTFGTDEQKAQFLKPIANGDMFFCQGFSEPNSGSDLASLSTTAVLDGDHYIVNGVKTWTSEGHFADYMFALVRTDPDVRAQAGISFLLIDMRAEGVEQRPLHMYDHQYTVNEVHLTNVRVPVAMRIGEENKGWDYAKFLLSRERGLVARSWIIRHELEMIKQFAREQDDGDGKLIDSPAFRRKIAKLEIELNALRWQVSRLITDAAPNPTASTAVLKIRGGESQQAVSGLAMDAIGPYAAAYFPNPEPGQEFDLDQSDYVDGPEFAPAYAAGKLQHFLFRRAVTIFGGSSEVQHGIIAKQMWGY